MDETFTSHDIAILRAYDLAYSFGDKKQEMLESCSMALLANINRGSGTSPYQPKDFMLGHREVEQVSEEDQITKMKMSMGWVPKPKEEI